LNNEGGEQVGASQVKLSEHSQALWEGLFDTRRYVRLYRGQRLADGQKVGGTAEDILGQLGVFLGEKVLGSKIMKALTQSRQRRTLLVRLPKTADDALAAAFARVPWEIARLGADGSALMEQNLVVRLVTEDTSARDDVVAAVAEKVAKGETLRVLFVYAEAPGSRPLAMRLERERLLEVFCEEILPRRKVKVDVVCHGVTRSVLREQIESSGGYHVVHWSGHGHLDMLELRGEDGSQDLMKGEDLVKLFVEAGGFVPQIVLLSACLSGAFVGIRNWEMLRAAMLGQGSGDKSGEARPLDELLGKATGYTGTALALLRSGVPQVIAMRYEVGDDYARELARWFYKRLLADEGRPETDQALALARGDLLREDRGAGRFGAVDHATPLIFGQAGRLLEPVGERSEQMDGVRPRPQPLVTGGSQELDRPDYFVGRGGELTRVNVEWLGKGGPAAALVQGLAGLGKTALAAEAIHLWHRRFDYVLAFQAKPTPLTIDEFYQKVDSKLTFESNAYRGKCERSPYAGVYLRSTEKLKGQERYERMRTNLVEALRSEAILLVLDNFETNLETVASDGGCRCADPQWDRLLEALVERLPETRSRVLITSRHLLSVLSGNDKVLWIPLGPLPMGEAGLYVRTHPVLCELYFADDEGRRLVERLLEVSRGHPLIMDRLAPLGRDRTALAEALEQVKAKGWKTLPDLFAATPSEKDKEDEREYLNDVAVGAVDVLIERLSVDARRLLWVVTLANEPVTEGMIADVWSGRSVEDEQLMQLGAMLKMADKLPEELRKELEEMAPELRERAKQLGERPKVPPVGPLLAELHGAGLLAREAVGGGEDGKAVYGYGFHELVRERIGDWMAAHADERGERTGKQVWLAYAERYEGLYDALKMSGKPRARAAAAEMGRRALVYVVRAAAFERLGSFASGPVTGPSDPTLLRGVIGELEAAAEQVPAGKDRWSVRTYLADALSKSGRPDEALSLYEQAAAEAEAAGHWADVGWICGNWAIAVCRVGKLEKAKDVFNRCITALRTAGSAKVSIFGNELEMLRIDVIQGKAKEILGEIEKRLDEVRQWWERDRAGERVPEAPDAELLGRVLVGGLDIARQANWALERWQECLDLLKEIEEVERELGESEHELVRARFNQYGPLLRLGRLDEAQRLLEGCLAVYRDADDLTRQARALSALGSVWAQRGDLAKAVDLERQALAVRNRLPDPAGRAISHLNLSNYLDEMGQVEEYARHQLAAVVYRVVCGLHQLLGTSVRNLGMDIRRAARAGGRNELPRLAEVRADPEFAALRVFLEQGQVDVGQLQGEIDRLVEAVRKGGA
jgi:tetratricopeptide (TPR) repeat protein